MIIREMYSHTSRLISIEGAFFHGGERDFAILRERDFAILREQRRPARGWRRMHRCTQAKGGASRSRKDSSKVRKSAAAGRNAQKFDVFDSLKEMAADGEYLQERQDEDPNDDLAKFKALVLDLSYRPINVINWKRSLCLEILERAEVLVYYDQIVCSTSRAFFIPAVLRMSDFVYAPKPRSVKLSLSRTNVFIRDKFKCQYCDRRDDLTIDHVLPVSKGGLNTWNNLVTACKFCNSKKGSRSIEDADMQLSNPPKEPRAFDNRELPPNYRVFKATVLDHKVPSEWLNFLPRRSSDSSGR